MSFDWESKRKIKDNGDYYFSISGSITDGFTVHYYRKLGWNSVTTEYKDLTLTHLELIEFLSNKDNLFRDKD